MIKNITINKIKNEAVNTRNIGISAHIDSGKTTLTERILYYAGKIHKIEEVRGGGAGATMDHMELEKEKGITITSAATTVVWNDKKINIIDTPGHVDFTIEVERSLRVLDGAILVLCGVAGVQSQSITVDRQIKRYNIPRLIFINKLDRLGANPYRCAKELNEVLDLNAILTQIPIGLENHYNGIIDLVSMKAIYFYGKNGENVKAETIPKEFLDDAKEHRFKMLETISMFNDQLMENLLEENEIEENEIHDAIKTGVNLLKLCPVYLGSAKQNKGVQPLLNAVIQYLPSPLERKLKATSIKLDKDINLECDPEKPTVAMVFKLTEEQFGQLTYTRIYQGKLRKGEQLVNTRTGKKMRVGRMVRMHANDRDNIDYAEAGDIIALVGIECASGDTLCDENFLVSCEPIFRPDPVISLAIYGQNEDQRIILNKALQRFMREDPTFYVKIDPESGQTIISGMGELHLDIYIERMRREYDISPIIGAPQVNYRETITSSAEFDYLHKKQTGGAGQFAGVSGTIEPFEEEFEFVNQITSGRIPTEHIPACEKGFKDVMVEGPLASYPVTGVKVTLKDGKYHDVDSSDMAYQLACRYAMREAIKNASPILLEPIMKVEVNTPFEYQGSIMGNLNSRRGIIYSSKILDKEIIINAGIPLSEMFGYATELRSLSAGKATYSMEFEKYNQCPSFIQEKIIAGSSILRDTFSTFTKKTNRKNKKY